MNKRKYLTLKFKIGNIIILNIKNIKIIYLNKLLNYKNLNLFKVIKVINNFTYKLKLSILIEGIFSIFYF